MLKDKTAESCRTNKIYKEGFVSNVPQRNKHSDIIVESGTTLATARKYLHIGKTAVLNFANPGKSGRWSSVWSYGAGGVSVQKQ